MAQQTDTSAVVPLIKHFLFCVNVLFFAVGIGLTLLSVYALSEDDETIGCFMDFLFSPPCLLCLLGCLILVPSFLGLYGALRENTCILKMYLGLGIILLGIEVVLVIFVFVFAKVPEAFSNIGVYPQDFLEKSIEKYRDRVHSEEDGCGRNGDDYLDFIQDKFECCGSSDDDQGYLDWEKNQYYSCNSTTPEACSVPISCCKADTTTYECGLNMLKSGTTDFSAIYTQGCEKGMREVLKDNLVALGCASFGGIAIQIIFITLGMRLHSQVMEQRSKW